MNIIFGGHLDRAFLLGTKPDRFRTYPSDAPSSGLIPDAYRSFFHCAGMMAVLSDSVVQPEELPANTGPALTRRDASGQTYDAVGLVQLEKDALRFAKAIMQPGILSGESLAFARIIARDDPHQPNEILHVEGLMFDILHAWRTQSTLVLCAGDQRILAEIGTKVIEMGIALPFGIPDLRSLAAIGPTVSGAIPNLEPGDVADVNAWRKDPVLRTYRRRLDRLSDVHREKVSALLQSAFEESRKSSQRIRDTAADITLISHKARMLDNSDITRILVDPFGWSQTQISRYRMPVIVLSNGRRLN